MKSKVLMLAAAVMACLSGMAQETETIYSTEAKERPMNTLIKGDKGFGGHLSTNLKGTEVLGETAGLVGGELVFTIAHSLNLGFAGYGLATNVKYDYPQTIGLNQTYLQMGYGGVLVEPVFFDQSLVHFTVPVLIGGGWSGVSRYSHYHNGYDYEDYIIEDTGFFVFEPGINMEVNIARYVKLTLGGTYRLVAGSELRDVSDSDLSGFSISGGLRFGWF